MLRVIDAITSIDITSSQNSPHQILTLLDELAATLIQSVVNTTSPITFSGTNIGFSLQAIPSDYNSILVASITQEKNLIGVTFSNPKTEDSRQKTEQVERIQLPRELFHNLSVSEPTNHESFNKSGENEPTNHVYSYVFKNNNLFVSNNSLQRDELVNSESKTLVPKVDGHVLAITVHGKTIKGLKKPVSFTTKVSQKNKNGICAYWKVEGNVWLYLSGQPYCQKYTPTDCFFVEFSHWDVSVLL